MPSPEEALATEFNEPELDYIRYQQSLALEGGPERVREGLLAIADEYEADDVIIVTITHDYAARLRSYELVARAFGLSERADSLPPEPGSR